MLDRKSDPEIDWSEHKITEEQANAQYHITDFLGSRISDSHVLFSEEMMDKPLRDAAANKALYRHTVWKVAQHTTYRQECELYLRKRRRWEWSLVKEAVEINGIQWPFAMAKKDILAKADPRGLGTPADCRPLIEREITKARHRPQDSDSTESINSSESS